MPKKVVFILGIGRSGSTLLDLMLGSHPECFSMGEICKIPEIYKKNKAIKGNQFWEESFDEKEAKMLAVGLSNHRVNKYIPLKYERCIRELLKQDKMLNPYSLIFKKVQASVLIDSSKYVDWVSQKLTAREFKSGQIDPYVIFLIRDGRAVLNSYLRKFPERTVQKISHNWLRRMKGSQELYNKFPEERKMIVRYEKLASETEATLESICKLLAIEYTPEMMEYWKNEHNMIAGGQGARYIASKYQGKQAEVQGKVEATHGDYYDKLGLAIKLDLRWQRELSPENLAEFHRIVGDYNKPYEWN